MAKLEHESLAKQQSWAVQQGIVLGTKNKHYNTLAGLQVWYILRAKEVSSNNHHTKQENNVLSR